MLIRNAETDADVARVRELWTEYWTALGLPLEFQGFAEQLKRLPGEFAPPAGLLLIALNDAGRSVGTVAVRPIGHTACEAKRLYVKPVHRGSGLGKALLLRAIQEARGKGYAEMFGDTLPSMQMAARMYRDIGFQQVGPYSPEPTPGAIYLRLSLNGAA